MKLFYSPTAPFVRKVMVFAHEVGLIDKVTIVRSLVSPLRRNDELAVHNPLMKVPTLLSVDGNALFGSQLICEYLDTLHLGRRLIPQDGNDRWRVGSLHAIADGILDAGLLCQESASRLQNRSDPWLEGQRIKVIQGLNVLEERTGELAGEINVGLIAVGVAVGWLNFRNIVGDACLGRTRLAEWFAEFSRRPSMLSTEPREDSFSGSITAQGEVNEEAQESSLSLTFESATPERAALMQVHSAIGMLRLTLTFFSATNVRNLLTFVFL